MNENTIIENIQGQIRKCQKKIQLNYSILHSEDLEENISKALIEEISNLREEVTNYQEKLRELYRDLFSGSKKVQPPLVANHRY